MAILLITWNFPPRRGGIENLMAHLYRGLRTKHRVIVITAYADLKDNGVWRAPWRGLLPFACYALWRGAVLLFRDPEITVVFGGSAMVTPLVYLLARLFRRKAFVQTHGLDLLYRSVLYQALCVLWLQYCDAVIANSNYTATLARERGVSGEIICVIALGVDVAQFAPASDRRQLKEDFLGEDRQIILFVGRLARRKGVQEFVEHCLPTIVQQRPEVCFFIAGGNPSDSLTHCEDVLGKVEAVVRNLGLQDHVRLCGEVRDEELLKLYQSCDIVVLPALALAEDVEGFGMVLLEAAATGKPVVATDVGGISDAVENGKTGFLVKAGDYAAFSGAVLQLLNNDQLRFRFGKKSRERVQMHCTWEKVTAQYDNLFLRL
jgi:phosphatidylinositol alpha-1,6-mannosyltransferase